MAFIKYQHVERFGTPEVADIVSLEEPCYVFPKVDGTNGSVWLEEDGELHFGSRNREVSLENDNQAFMATLHTDSRLIQFFAKHPEVRLYGEWLVPHTLKTYEDSSWREFYVFDVCQPDGSYVPYEVYKEWLSEVGLEYVPCLAIVERGNEETFVKFLDQNTYLMQQGEIGEGIVIKRYGYTNKYGRTAWAKIVRNDFKAKHQKVMGPAKIKSETTSEDRIIAQFLTHSIVDKVHAKIVAEQGEWRSQYIPRLLHTVFYDLVSEECWNFVKALKNPTIDFGLLQKLCYSHIKQMKPELF